MMRSAFLRSNHDLRIRLAMAWCLGLASLTGCDSGDQGGIDPAWKLDEHGIPDFKPVDFEMAIAESKLRFDEVAAKPSPETSPEAEKFRQILRWMPEFAADTPIRRTGWDELAQRCARLEEAARRPGFFVREKADTFRGEIEAIAALIPPDPLYRKLDSPANADRSKPGEAGQESIDRTGGNTTEAKGNDR